MDPRDSDHLRPTAGASACSECTPGTYSGSTGPCRGPLRVACLACLCTSKLVSGEAVTRRFGRDQLTCLPLCDADCICSYDTPNSPIHNLFRCTYQSRLIKFAGHRCLQGLSQSAHAALVRLGHTRPVQVRHGYTMCSPPEGRRGWTGTILWRLAHFRCHSPSRTLTTARRTGPSGEGSG